MYSIEKASAWKRISAALFDAIILVITAVGIAFCLSSLFNYQSHYDRLEEIYTRIEAEYGVDFDITSEEYEEMTEEQKKQYVEKANEASKAINEDDEAKYVFETLFTLSLIILSFSILIAYLLLDMLIPVLLKNGQTIGKKLFGVAVIREDGVKVSPLLMFIRTLLGKYAIETMLPVLIIMMLFFGIPDPVGMIVIVALVMSQIIMFVFTKKRTVIHDRLSHTVCVDFATQMIFDSPEALAEYKVKLQAKIAERSQD